MFTPDGDRSRVILLERLRRSAVNRNMNYRTDWIELYACAAGFSWSEGDDLDRCAREYFDQRPKMGEILSVFMENYGESIVIDDLYWEHPWNREVDTAAIWMCV